MANDFLKKEPSKTEKMLYELAMAQRQMEKGLWSTSTVVMALAILTKTKPEELAEFMSSGEDKIKEFSEKLNEIIKIKQAEKNSEGKT
ncbi:MAG: hypothetical protein HYZ51_00705 [Candidatus Doudnabacteria bacterium]|nr:hypothetical protein [Candidatus Doudnabacteria bacterium]